MKYKITYSNMIMEDKSGKKESIPLIHISDEYIFSLYDSSNITSRILSYKNTGAAIISASRGEYVDKDSPEKITPENLKRTKLLEQDLRDIGFGFRPVIGGFKENFGTPEEKLVNELSFIVPKPKDVGEDKFLNIMLNLGKKYEQDSILVVLPTINNGNPVYLDTKTNIGKEEMDFNTYRFAGPEDIYFTKLIKGNTPAFTLEKKDSLNNKYKFFVNPNLTMDSIGNYYFGKLFPKSTGLWYNNTYDVNTGEFKPNSRKRF